MALTLRSYEPHDFAALYKLDQACFPQGIAYSKTMLRYFLKLPSADGTVAEDAGKIVGFILPEENPPLAHVITLDVAESHRRQGVGSTLLAESEKNLALRGVRTILLDTAPDNGAGVAFSRDCQCISGTGFERSSRPFRKASAATERHSLIL